MKEEARKLKKEIKANSKSDKKEQEKDDQKGLLMFIMFFSRKYLTRKLTLKILVKVDKREKEFDPRFCVYQLRESFCLVNKYIVNPNAPAGIYLSLASFFCLYS